VLDVRVRGRIAPQQLEQQIGKVLTPGDVDLLITGSALVRKPNGEPLCIVVRGAVPVEARQAAYPVLHGIRALTDNRGMASGTPRLKTSAGQVTRARRVMSSILGSFEAYKPRFPACRLTAWTGQHADQYTELRPLLQAVSDTFAEYVPDRYKVQAEYASRSRQDWIIPNTVFSTLTVNNTYSTGVHKDDGDLKEGFSCLTVMRRGQYEGGWLCFPEYRVGVDLDDGDVILMDAHEWHGNVDLVPLSEDAERISVVCYFRTKIAQCATMSEENEKARTYGVVPTAKNDVEASQTVTTSLRAE
jgi:hypothetical protein